MVLRFNPVRESRQPVISSFLLLALLLWVSIDAPRCGDEVLAGVFPGRSKKTNEVSPDRVLTIAGQFEKQGDYLRALNLYRNVLQQHPGHLEARRRFDLCQAELDRAGRETGSSSSGIALIPTQTPQTVTQNANSFPPAVGHEYPDSPNAEPLATPSEVIYESSPPAIASTSDIAPPRYSGETDEIPYLGDESDREPGMLSVTTQPIPFSQSGAPVENSSVSASILAIPSGASRVTPERKFSTSYSPTTRDVVPNTSVEGPQLTLKKLETRITVSPESLSASAGSITHVRPGPQAEGVRPSPQEVLPGTVTLDDLPSSQDIGRVQFSKKSQIPVEDSVVAPELEASPPATRETPGNPTNTDSVEQSEPSSPQDVGSVSEPTANNTTDSSEMMKDDVITEGYRTDLLAICPRATQEIRRLIRSMETPNVRIRKTSLLRICELDQSAQSAIPAIRELLLDPDQSIRVLAAYGLWEIQEDPSGLPILVEGMVSGTSENKCLSIYLLGEMESHSAEVLGILEEISRNGEGLQKLHAAEALWKIRGGDSQALALMTSFLRNGDVYERWLASYMLGATGSKRLELIHELSTTLDDSSPLVRTSASFALGCIGPEAAMATPRLISIFETSEYDNALRVTAFEALSNIEPLTAKEFQNDQGSRQQRIRPVGETIRNE